jgi:hypothetical protein
MVTGAAFDDDDAAVQAITLLRESGVREQDITVLAAARKRAALVAGDRAWVPFKKWGGMRTLLARVVPGGGVPKEVRQRYARALKAGKIVVIAAAGGQPSDTIAALFGQSRADGVDQWWQSPCYLFAPPELAGPF